MSLCASSYRRIAWRIVRLPLLVYACLLVLMMSLENSLIFFPSPYPQGNWQPRGLVFEDAWFQAEDGMKLHGWYAPVAQPRAVLLFCHGNAGNITHRADRMLSLQQRFRVSSMFFDYRGYGRSEGSPNERGVLQDARAARAWLSRKTGVPESRIVLQGESLGGAAAVDLAAEGAAGLILENTFTSLRDVAAHHYPWLPVRWLMRTRLDALSKIAAYRGPLLWSHGDADTIVPIVFGQRLFEAANEPKRGFTFAGADHNDAIHPEDRPEFAAALDEFFSQIEADK